MSEIKETRVLVTGFGPFLDIKTNPSWEIARQLPKTLLSSTGQPIKLIVPDTYMPVSYSAILAQTPKLIEQLDPDLVVHVGLAVDREYYAVEQSAAKDGYHDVPGQDRRVFTRAENKRVFGKASEVLKTSLDLESAVEGWRGACERLSDGKGKGKAKGRERDVKEVDVRLSDDVGNFVCGFVYYLSLLEMQKRRGMRNVVFLHVPMMEGEVVVGRGVEVVKALVGALVETYVEQTQ